jgi:hypothetical protein
MPVGRPGLRRPKARQPHAHIAGAGALDQVREQQDQLGVERRIVGAERLGADLGELTEASGLRRLVAEERSEVPQLHRLRQLVHAVLGVGAADARRALRPQRERTARLVGEGEHLLLHDVGRLPHPAREQLRVLEHGRLERLVAGTAEQLTGQLGELQPAAALTG